MCLRWEAPESEWVQLLPHNPKVIVHSPDSSSVTLKVNTSNHRFTQCNFWSDVYELQIVSSIWHMTTSTSYVSLLVGNFLFYCPTFILWWLLSLRVTPGHPPRSSPVSDWAIPGRAIVLCSSWQESHDILWLKVPCHGCHGCHGFLVPGWDDTNRKWKGTGDQGNGDLIIGGSLKITTDQLNI